jgi:hypothetical protein
MKRLLQNPNMRFSIALGATIGIGQALVRGLTENLGSITGLLVSLPLIAGIALAVSLLLEQVAKRSASRTSSEST